MSLRRSCASSGFTLIEVIVALAIVAILTAVALPSYTSHVARAKRAEARTVLYEAAQFAERAYSANNSYTDLKLPQRLESVPGGSAAGLANYTVVLSSTTETYTITATPVAPDPCGALKLTHTGERDRTGTAMSLEECWR